MDLSAFLSNVRETAKMLVSAESDAAVELASAELRASQDILRSQYSHDDSILIVTQLLLLYVLDTLQAYCARDVFKADMGVSAYFRDLKLRLAHDTSPGSLLRSQLERTIGELRVCDSSFENLADQLRGVTWVGSTWFSAFSSGYVLAAEAMEHLGSAFETLKPDAVVPSGVFAALGVAYDRLVERSFERVGGHYAITPSRVVDLMIGLAQVQQEETVFDPACGTARILTRTLRRSSKSQGLGIEVNASVFLVGTLSLLLNGLDRGCILLDDTLARPTLPLVPDVIISHLPFGKQSHSAFSYSVSDGADLELDFLRYLQKHLSSGRRAIVAVSEHVLFQRGWAEEVRRMLVEDSGLQAVISLPPGTFRPLANSRGSVLVLDPSIPRSEVLFYAIPDRRRTGVELSDQDVQLCLKAYFGHAEESESLSNSWRVPVSELAADHFNLQAKPRIGRMLSSLIGNVRMAELAPIAEAVERGIPYHRNDVKDRELSLDFAENQAHRGMEMLAPEWVPLVRVSDLSKGAVRTTAMVIRTDAVPSSKLQLREQDVLLSIGGTIGKVAVCSKRLVGATFSNGLIAVRCRDELLPEFLASYLNASAVQTHLRSLATGAVIQHLSVNLVRKLQVPLIPIDLQHELLIRAQSGTDVFESLRLLGRHFTSPDWVTKVPMAEIRSALGMSQHQLRDNTAVRQLTKFGEPGSKTTSFEVQRWLQNIRYAVRALREELSQTAKYGPAATQLLHALLSRIDRVGTAVQLSDPQDMVNDLDQIRLSLTRISQDTHHDLDPEIGDYLSKALKGLDAVCIALAEPYLIQTRIEVQISAQKLSDLPGLRLDVTMDNVGPLPVSEVRILIPEFMRAGLLDDNASQVQVRKIGPREKTIHTIYVKGDPELPSVLAVHWSVRDIHLQLHEDDLVVTVTQLPVVTHPYVDIPRNPYITGTPVAARNMFFGRSDVIHFLTTRLFGEHQKNVVLLVGNRRTGKSSILRQIEKHGLLGDVVPVYIDIQGMGVLTEHSLYFKLAALVSHSLGVAGIPVEAPARSDLSSDDSFWDFCSLLVRYLDLAGKPIVLLFDEFECLEEAINQGDLNKRVLENLRHLFQHYPTLGTVITGTSRLIPLHEDYRSILFSLALHKNIGALDAEAAADLVTKPLHGMVEFAPDAVQCILDMTACQPYFIQMTCHTLVADLQRRRDTSFVSVRRVNDVIPTVIEAASDHLNYMVGQASNAVQRTLLAYIAQRQGSDDLPNHSDLVGFLIQRDIESSAKQLDQHLRHMREVDLIAMERRGTQQVYRIPVDLVRHWVLKYVDLDSEAAQAADEL